MSHTPLSFAEYRRKKQAFETLLAGARHPEGDALPTQEWQAIEMLYALLQDLERTVEQTRAPFGHSSAIS